VHPFVAVLLLFDPLDRALWTACVAGPFLLIGQITYEPMLILVYEHRETLVHLHTIRRNWDTEQPFAL